MLRKSEEKYLEVDKPASILRETLKEMEEIDSTGILKCVDQHMVDTYNAISRAAKLGAYRLLHFEEMPQQWQENPLVCSVMYHVFIHCAHIPVMKCAATFDYIGISLLITASILITEYYSFYCSPLVCCFYMIFTSLAGLVPIMCSILFKWWDTKPYRLYRVGMFVMLGSSGIFPLTHLIHLHGVVHTWHFVSPIISSIAAYLTGVWIYANRFPERKWPGKLDRFGIHSHSVWHVFVCIAHKYYSTTTSPPDLQKIKPLNGIRVLELGQMIAGPFCASILGYYGAEVIKIEPPKSGDPLRIWRHLDKDGCSPWFRSLGRNKKSCEINLRADEGRKLIRQLADRSDVLIENFKP
ncbi:7822_t:CDS:2, partial [Ambispora leptoticha]